MIRRVFLCLALILPAAAGLAEQRGWFAIGGVAIQGYDAVAYFTESRAVQGRAEHSVKWMGALWYFVSDDNRALFEANPRAYAPQYGGYCAYAMAEGREVPSTPAAFSITDGKLYLHRSAAERALWRQHFSDNIARADEHWPGADRE